MLSTLTNLSSLTWIVGWQLGHGNAFQELAHLTGLSELEVSADHIQIVGHEELACIACLTLLTRLDMTCCRLADLGVPPSALAPLTRLVSLGLFRGTSYFSGACLWSFTPFLPSLDLEALRSLTVSHGDMDISVLRAATALTQLGCCWYEWEPRDELGPLLAGIPELRSLGLSITTGPCCDGFLE
jgi:hypothetical protein